MIKVMKSKKKKKEYEYELPRATPTNVLFELGHTRDSMPKEVSEWLEEKLDPFESLPVKVEYSDEGLHFHVEGRVFQTINMTIVAFNHNTPELTAQVINQLRTTKRLKR